MKGHFLPPQCSQFASQPVQSVNQCSQSTCSQYSRHGQITVQSRHRSARASPVQASQTVNRGRKGQQDYQTCQRNNSNPSTLINKSHHHFIHNHSPPVSFWSCGRRVRTRMAGFCPQSLFLFISIRFFLGLDPFLSQKKQKECGLLFL